MTFEEIGEIKKSPERGGEIRFRWRASTGNFYGKDLLRARGRRKTRKRERQNQRLEMRIYIFESCKLGWAYKLPSAEIEKKVRPRIAQSWRAAQQTARKGTKREEITNADERTSPSLSLFRSVLFFFIEISFPFHFEKRKKKIKNKNQRERESSGFSLTPRWCHLRAQQQTLANGAGDLLSLLAGQRRMTSDHAITNTVSWQCVCAPGRRTWNVPDLSSIRPNVRSVRSIPYGT